MYVKRENLTAFYCSILLVLTVLNVSLQKHPCTLSMFASVWLSLLTHRHPNMHACSDSGERLLLSGTRWRSAVFRDKFYVFHTFWFCSYNLKIGSNIISRSYSSLKKKLLRDIFLLFPDIFCLWDPGSSSLLSGFLEVSCLSSFFHTSCSEIILMIHICVSDIQFVTNFFQYTAESGT